MLPRALLILCLVSIVGAADLRAAEASVWIARSEGELTIGPDGQVLDVTLTMDADKSVRNAVEARVRTWRFEPIVEAGRPVKARAPMVLRLAATEAADGSMEVRIEDVFFPLSKQEKARAAGFLLQKERIAYPKRALRALVGGEVLLVVELDDQGVPQHVTGRSSWLYGPSSAARKRVEWMDMLIESAARSVRNWRFATPEVIGSRTVQVPVTFEAGNRPFWHQAHWVSYDEPDRSEGSSTRLSPDGQPSDTDVKLLTPPQGSGGQTHP